MRLARKYLVTVRSFSCYGIKVNATLGKVVGGVWGWTGI